LSYLSINIGNASPSLRAMTRRISLRGSSEVTIAILFSAQEHVGDTVNDQIASGPFSKVLQSLRWLRIEIR
jgi:hypothetical protein